MKLKCHQQICQLFIVLLFVTIFFGFLSGGRVLLGSDPVISAANLSTSEAVGLIRSGWKPAPLLGTSASPGLNFLRVLLFIFQDGILWNNWYHGLGCLLASFFLFRFLRSSGLSHGAATLATIGAFWVGVNLTILYAAHPAKPYIVMLFVAALLPARRAGEGSVVNSLLWGGCIGLMFVHQADVALFFALFAGVYFLFRLYRGFGFKSLVKWLRILLPALLFSFLFASGPLLSGYKKHVKDSVQIRVQTPQQKWDYVTQWSFPPEESIAFVAPGYTGWRSGEPEGPYWGRMGRSSGWEQTRQGFQNFKLENMYLGIIPVAFALFALFSCRRSKHKAEVLFWGGATLVALLLSFGKFFPLYSLFYKLPVVNNIRNPNKFLQVFQVCLAILTAYGVDALFSQRSKVKGQRSEGRHPTLNVKSRKPNDSDLCPLSSEIRHFFWFMSGILGVLMLWVLSLMINRTDGVAEFVSLGWPQEAARVIVQNKITALWHASFMAAIMTGVFALFRFPLFVCPERSRWGKALRYKNWIAAGLVLIVAADAVKLSKHYVKEMPRSYIEANPITDFIHKGLGHQRVALAQEQHIFGVLKTYTLPYNGISVFNPGDMSRMPVDYQSFLQAAQKDPLALWEFSSVKYLLASTAIEKQVPASRLRKVFAFDVLSVPKGGFSVRSNMAGPVAVFELLNCLPRYALFAGSRKMHEEEALRRIGDLSQLSLIPDSQFPELPGSGLCGSVIVEEYHSDRVVLSVESNTDGILRCADRFTPDVVAVIDGTPAVVEPVDYLCRGVFVPAGAHTVEVRYEFSKLYYYLRWVGYLIFVSACLSLVGRWLKRSFLK